MASKKPISAYWLDQDKGEDRTKTEEIVRHNIFLLSRLQSILLRQLSNIENEEQSKGVYDNPSWAFKQAHLNGMRQSYKEILKLTDFLN